MAGEGVRTGRKDEGGRMKDERGGGGKDEGGRMKGEELRSALDLERAALAERFGHAATTNAVSEAVASACPDGNCPSPAAK